jgi:hypothetical protein
LERNWKTRPFLFSFPSGSRKTDNVFLSFYFPHVFFCSRTALRKSRLLKLRAHECSLAIPSALHGVLVTGIAGLSEETYSACCSLSYVGVVSRVASNGRTHVRVFFFFFFFFLSFFFNKFLSFFSKGRERELDLKKFKKKKLKIKKKTVAIPSPASWREPWNRI